MTGIAQAFGGPAYQSLIPQLVSKENLPNAIAPAPAPAAASSAVSALPSLNVPRLQQLCDELDADYHRYNDTKSDRFNLVYAEGFEAMTCAMAMSSMDRPASPSSATWKRAASPTRAPTSTSTTSRRRRSP